MDRVTEEALCDLQAQVYVLRQALRAMLRTHPDPSAALASWKAVLADASITRPVVPSYARGSDYIADRCQAFGEDWTAELVDFAVSHTPSSSN
jgi:hypothetical protein